jgi:hypothetical protein
MRSRNLSIVTPAKAGVQNSRRCWIPAFAGMTKVVLLATFVTLTLAACGRKDVPDYPKDAIDRPGTFDRTQRNQNPRYY